MRIRTWLRAALPPSLVMLAILALHRGDPISAQAGAREQTIYASALDRSGAPVAGLGPDAFVVKENGATREILRVAPADDPIAITILVDNSQAATDAMNYLRKALPNFITAVAPGNTVSLIGLADRPTILTPFTTDVKQLSSRAGGLFALRDTGATLLDGLYEVAQGLKSRDVPRAAIVAIITDGPEFTNRYSKDVIAELKRAQTSVHLVTVGVFEHSNDNLAIRERSFLLTEVPRATGGALYTMLSPNGIAQNLDKIANELKSQYEVVYGRPERTIPPDTIEISSARDGLTVRGTPARTRKGA